MDPYEARQDVIEKMLLEELEAQSHSNICDSKADRSNMSDSEYVSFEYSDQEECDHVSTHETESDGDNMTASDYSDTDSDTEEGYEEEMDKLGINYPLL
jgi:hypothetical protein